MFAVSFAIILPNIGKEQDIEQARQATYDSYSRGKSTKYPYL